MIQSLKMPIELIINVVKIFQTKLLIGSKDRNL